MPIKTIIAFLFLCLSLPAFAQTIPLGTDQADTEIKRIENYFNNIKSLRANFIQVNSNRSQSRGKFYLGSNGRMRFEYAPPDPHLLLSTGSGFIYVDRDLEEVTRASLSDVPLGFLFSGDVVMRGEDHRVDRIEVRGDRLVMTLELFVGDISEVDLVFDLRVFGLVGWRTVGGGGDKVVVDLVDIEKNVELENGLFRFNDF